jgi:glycine/D-amino acid oxidase-like deaminating enzyme
VPDVAIIGGGIVGCSAAAFLAEAGASVELFERGELAGAASGRNSGVIQHPFDPVLAELHFETLELLRELEGFSLPAKAAGILMIEPTLEALAPVAAEIEQAVPALEPTLLDGDELSALEPALAPGLAACRLETGYPVRPAEVTLAYAARARRAGAALHERRAASVAGVREMAGAVLVAAGPWTPALVDPGGAWRPIEPVWGVVAELALPQPPRHVVEEAGVERVHGGEPGAIFSLVSAGGVSSLGSTFLFGEPEPLDWTDPLLERGRRYLPALAGATVTHARACARPQSFDGRPLVGKVDGVWVAAGHGPWGISTGPATGRLAADLVLGQAAPPAPLDAARFQ